MKNILYRTIMVLAILAVLFSITGQSVSADAPAPVKQAATFEIKFMEGMIDHHMMAIMMAEMCTMKAVHPELIAACEEIIATQNAEMMMMQMWLQDWYGIIYEPKMMMGDMHGHQMLDSNQFEIWFMKRMIIHHAGAIREAHHCLEAAFHNELLSTCQDIINAQSLEIAEMQAWLCEWYGICNFRKNL